MCRKRCGIHSHASVCICAVAVVHITIGVTLVAALVTKYVVFKPEQHLDLPGDIRLIENRVDSIFCESHIVETSLVKSDKTQAKSTESNSLPNFDAYMLADQNTTARTRRTGILRGTGKVLARGESKYHSFNFLENSYLNISVCTQYSGFENQPPGNSTISGLFVYILNGKALLNKYLDMIKANPFKLPCSGNNCPSYFNVLPSDSCDDEEASNSYTYMYNITQSGEYFVLYVNGDTNNRSLVSAIEYNTNRTVYDTTAMNIIRKEYDITKFKLVPHKYLLMDFQYKQDITALHLYNIETSYVCVQNNKIYVMIFFMVPFLFLLIAGLFCICYGMNRRENFPAPGSDQPERGLLDSDGNLGYGSTDRIYT